MHKINRYESMRIFLHEINSMKREQLQKPIKSKIVFYKTV